MSGLFFVEHACKGTRTIMNQFADRDDAFQIQSIKSAYLREKLGGVKAVGSHLFMNAIEVLLSRGWSTTQIKERLLSSKTDASGVSNG